MSQLHKVNANRCNKLHINSYCFAGLKIFSYLKDSKIESMRKPGKKELAKTKDTMWKVWCRLCDPKIVMKSFVKIKCSYLKMSNIFQPQGITSRSLYITILFYLSVWEESYVKSYPLQTTSVYSFPKLGICTRRVKLKTKFFNSEK